MELDALSELPLLARCLYVFAIKPRMDIATGMVGINPKISWQALGEWLYIAPHPGVKGGVPSKGQLRRAAWQLEKNRLIKMLSLEKQLIFECPLVRRGYSVQNKADTNPTREADTKSACKNHLESNGCHINDVASRQVQNEKADTHPNKIRNIDRGGSILDHPKCLVASNSFGVDLPTTPADIKQWIHFFVQSQGFSEQAANTTKTKGLFSSWCQQKISFELVEHAIEIAHNTLGQKPVSPMFYKRFVESLIQEKTHPRILDVSHQEVRYGRYRKQSPAQLLWESCQGALKGTVFDPDNQKHH